MKSLVIIYTLVCAVLVLDAQKADEYVERSKRQAGLGMGDNCLMMYSVARQQVQCDPTSEVSDTLNNLRRDLTENLEETRQLHERMDASDINRERELSEDVQEQLSTLDDVNVKQASQEQKLINNNKMIQELSARIQLMEAANRQEMTDLMQMQTRLIDTTLDKTKITEDMKVLEEKMNRKVEEAVQGIDTAKGTTEAIEAIKVRLSELKDTINVVGGGQELLQSLTNKLINEIKAEAASRSRLNIDVSQVREALTKLTGELSSFKTQLIAFEEESTSMRSINNDLRREMDERHYMIPRTLKSRFSIICSFLVLLN